MPSAIHSQQAKAFVTFSQRTTSTPARYIVYDSMYRATVQYHRSQISGVSDDQRQLHLLILIYHFRHVTHSTRFQHISQTLFWETLHIFPPKKIITALHY